LGLVRLRHPCKTDQNHDDTLAKHRISYRSLCLGVRNGIRLGTQPSEAEIITASTLVEATTAHTPSTSEEGMVVAERCPVASITETPQPRDTEEHAPVPAAVAASSGPTERPPPKHRLFMHVIRTRKAERAQETSKNNQCKNKYQIPYF
jgi:hypothetical protein